MIEGNECRTEPENNVFLTIELFHFLLLNRSQSVIK